jgi:hypothetical protein
MNGFLEVLDNQKTYANLWVIFFHLLAYRSQKTPLFLILMPMV